MTKKMTKEWLAAEEHHILTRRKAEASGISSFDVMIDHLKPVEEMPEDVRGIFQAIQNSPPKLESV